MFPTINSKLYVCVSKNIEIVAYTYTYTYIMNPLLLISPCDGRYSKYTECCREYFSEYALQKKRVCVEVRYLHRLIQTLPQLHHVNTKPNIKILTDIADNFNIDECEKIKIIENRINHDVKAVEMYINSKCEDMDIGEYSSYVHFSLTSQDINNVVYPVLIKDFINDVYCNLIMDIIKKLDNMYTQYNGVVMLSHTHGQPGVPTTFGKEMNVFAYRLSESIKQVKNIKYMCKFGGAVGNFNAHVASYPTINWKQFSDDFVESFGCYRSQYTTQIDNYENLSLIFDSVKRINAILIDLCQDVWLYIFKNYLQLAVNTNEVGSSTMPHKVNPINFENAEGNLGVATSLFEFMSRKLPISRLQRDLTDSTVLRNVGVAFSHSIIGVKNILSGLDKIVPNKKVMSEDLHKNVVVLSEAYQTILRKYGMNDAYDKLKDFTRVCDSGDITLTDLHHFVDNLKINNNIKDELYNISLTNYIGFS